MKESEVKKAIVDSVRAAGGYSRRLEDRFSVGMPDIVLILPQLPVTWLEVKILYGHILRPSTRQYIELKRLIQPPHSLSLMAGWREGVLYVSDPKEEAYIEDCVRQEDGEPIPSVFERAIRAFGTGEL